MRNGLTVFLFCFVLGTATVYAYSDGSRLGAYTNAPSEGVCSNCHGNLNNGSGSLSISSSAGDYNPSDTLDLTITIANIGQIRWGFEVTILDGAGNFVGNMVLSDATRTVVNTSGGRQYVAHTSLGTDDGTADGTSWNFRWAAPASDAGPLTIYAAGVAANSAGGTGGDSVYSDTYVLGTTGIDNPVAGERPASFELSDNYPNPFNPTTTIEFDLSRRAEISLIVYNVLGETVRTLRSGTTAAGHYEVDWDGTDDSGSRVGSAIYFYRLTVDRQAQTKKMLLLK